MEYGVQHVRSRNLKAVCVCVHVCVVGQRSRVFYAALRTGNWGRRIREGGRGTAEMDGWPRREREGREKLRVCDRIETRRVKLRRGTWDTYL